MVFCGQSTTSPDHHCWSLHVTPRLPPPAEKGGERQEGDAGERQDGGGVCGGPRHWRMACASIVYFLKRWENK